MTFGLTTTAVVVNLTRTEILRIKTLVFQIETNLLPAKPLYSIAQAAKTCDHENILYHSQASSMHSNHLDNM